MPIPLALIAAGAAIGGGVINASNNNRQNRESQAFSRYMYDRQYNDALEFWQMQNTYNSPQAQMKRFQQAGLNPNLIYGQGSGAGNAGSIPTPNPTTPQFRPSEFGDSVAAAGNSYMNAIYDLEIKKQTANNLEKQGNVITEDAALRKAQTRATLTDAERKIFDLSLASELRGTSIDAAKEHLRQTKVTTDLAINRDAREAAMNASNIQEAAERMASQRESRAKSRQERASIREQINQMKKDGVLKDLDIELRRMGINPNDPTWARVVGRVLSNLFDGKGFQNTTGNIWKMMFGK